MRNKLTITLLLVLGASPALGITDEERATLLRASHEIEMIEGVIKEAEQAKNLEDREQISYQAIKDDLEKVKLGLLDVINAQRREPRSLPPVKGEYQ